VPLGVENALPAAAAAAASIGVVYWLAACGVTQQYLMMSPSARRDER